MQQHPRGVLLERGLSENSQNTPILAVRRRRCEPLPCVMKDSVHKFVLPDDFFFRNAVCVGFADADDEQNDAERREKTRTYGTGRGENGAEQQRRGRVADLLSFGGVIFQ